MSKIAIFSKKQFQIIENKVLISKYSQIISNNPLLFTDGPGPEKVKLASSSSCLLELSGDDRK